MIKNDTIMFTRRRNTCKKVQGFKVLYGKGVKGFKKRNTVQNVCWKITGKLDFVEISNFSN